MTHTHARTRSLVTSALLAALLAVSALIAVPVGAVPVTLQSFVVVLVGLVCTPRQAVFVVMAYLALGAVGLPVFAGGRGGVAAIVGPTGGYLIGFALGATMGAVVHHAVRARPVARDVAAAITVLVIVHACGATWLAHVAGLGAGAAIAAGVAPFALFDAVKAIGAITVASALRRAGFTDTPSGTARV